jgi:hypothetical protein
VPRNALRNESGGAVVEFALSTILLVPMALYSIYVGEAFIAGAKAQEIEISAAHDISAFLLHDYTGGGFRGLYTNAIDNSADRALSDLRDFDSFRRGSGGLEMVTSRARFSALPEGMECQLRTDLDSGAFRRIPGVPYPSALHREGFVNCKAQVTVQNFFIAKKGYAEFHPGGPDLMPTSIATLKICGIGEDLRGCKGGSGRPGSRGFWLLTDDWGLEDSRPNPVGTQDNNKYYFVGKQAYGSLGQGSTMIVAGIAALGIFPPPLLGDQAKTSTFKMGYLKNIREARNISPQDRGERRAHLSPLEEDRKAFPYTDSTLEVSNVMYTERRRGHYLGKQDPQWNAR